MRMNTSGESWVARWGQRMQGAERVRALPLPLSPSPALPCCRRALRRADRTFHNGLGQALIAARNDTITGTRSDGFVTFGPRRRLSGGRAADRCDDGARGFTLIELLVVMAVLAIAISIVLPYFEHVILRSRLQAVARELVSDAIVARTEAIRRGAVVRLCSSSDGRSCGGDWSEGWIVRVGSAVLERKGPVPGGFRILASGSMRALVFKPTGATPAKFTICRATPKPGSEERVVTIAPSGRADVSRSSTGSCGAPLSS